MEKNFDLSVASHEELLALIAEQQAVIQGLQRRVATLEEQLRHSGGGSAMPGTKPATTRRRERKGQRKPRPHGFARRRMTPTERVDHPALRDCPDCGTRLQGGWVQRTREVLELPAAPLRVVERRFLARTCPLCRKRWVASAALGDVAVGKQRLGVGLVSLIATLRETGRLPIRTIQWWLETVYQLHLSVGGIVAALHQTAGQAQGAVAAVRERIRASPVVHADETGWREDGANGYVWTFSTPTERYFLRRGRGKGVVDEALGEEFMGVLVSDFYAAYNHYPGLHQRCWAHLFRDIHTLRQLYPDDEGLGHWAAAVRALYDDACRVPPLLDTRLRRQEQWRLEERLMALCHPFLDDRLAVQRKLCRRVERFLPELFVFVAQPMVPPDNNAAERSLRHLVIQRKISGGTRSPRGTATAMTLASLFGAWRLQGINPLDACRQLLISPQV